MNRTQLPAPPNPSDVSYAGSVQTWAQDMYRWAQQVKGRIETDSAVNIKPVAPFQLGTYTATYTLTGTDATSNYVATLVAAMTTKGLVAPVSPRVTT